MGYNTLYDYYISDQQVAGSNLLSEDQGDSGMFQKEEHPAGLFSWG